MNKLILGLNQFFKYSKDKPLSYFKYIGDKIPKHEFTTSINLKDTNFIYTSNEYYIKIEKLNKGHKGHVYNYSKGESLFKPLIGTPFIKKYDKDMNEIDIKFLKDNEFNYVDDSCVYYQIVNNSDSKNYFLQIYKPKIF